MPSAPACGVSPANSELWHCRLSGAAMITGERSPVEPQRRLDGSSEAEALRAAARPQTTGPLLPSAALPRCAPAAAPAKAWCREPRTAEACSVRAPPPYDRALPGQRARPGATCCCCCRCGPGGRSDASAAASDPDRGVLRESESARAGRCVAQSIWRLHGAPNMHLASLSTLPCRHRHKNAARRIVLPHPTAYLPRRETAQAAGGAQAACAERVRAAAARPHCPPPHQSSHLPPLAASASPAAAAAAAPPAAATALPTPAALLAAAQRRRCAAAAALA